MILGFLKHPMIYFFFLQRGGSLKHSIQLLLLWPPLSNYESKLSIESCRTRNSAVSFSFRSFRLARAASPQRRALVCRSLEPPEITPDFENSVPSRETVCREKKNHISRDGTTVETNWVGCSQLVGGGGQVTLWRSCMSKATLRASLMVSHTKVLPHTNCNTFRSWGAPWPPLTCTTSISNLALGTSRSRSFRGLTLEAKRQQLSTLGYVQHPLQASGGHTHIQVVDGEEGLALGSLLLDEGDAVAGHLLRGDHDGVHVAAKDLGDGQLVLPVDGTAQVRQAAVLPGGKKSMMERDSSTATGSVLDIEPVCLCTTIQHDSNRNEETVK